MTTPDEYYYVLPTLGDFRQGDIYRDCLHLMLSQSGYRVLRERPAAQGRTQVFLHGEENPPKDGFRWDSKENVAAEGQLAMCVVLTHDCETENADNRNHRLIGLVRPLELLPTSDRQIVVQNRNYARLYLPAWHAQGIPESYLDLRRITTIRRDALPEDKRIASMTDGGREILQKAIIRYLTNQYRVTA